ncbi:unnamed protein product, partial [Musa acuminata var. zebrina]
MSNLSQNFQNRLLKITETLTNKSIQTKPHETFSCNQEFSAIILIFHTTISSEPDTECQKLDESKTQRSYHRRHEIAQLPSKNVKRLVSNPRIKKKKKKKDLLKSCRDLVCTKDLTSRKMEGEKAGSDGNPSRNAASATTRTDEK